MYDQEKLAGRFDHASQRAMTEGFASRDAFLVHLAFALAFLAEHTRMDEAAGDTMDTSAAA